MPDKLRFLSLDFDLADPATWRTRLLSPTAEFRYMVTPNVDHIVQMSKRADIAPVYAAAEWRMCDSRILQKLASLRGIDLRCYPGADLVQDLFHDPRSSRLKIAAVGPDFENFEILRKRFPEHDLILVETPMMRPGSPEWEAVLTATEAAQADLTLLCISFPKQEVFARDLKMRGRARGNAVCAGASIDFLTGQQTRAPSLFRKTGMEWLYRLLSQPGRLWKRYLVDGPKIFLIFLRDKG